MCAALLNSDLESLLNYGKSWLLEFEVKKTQALTVSRKRDPNKNPPLVMDGIPFAERKTLKILGYMFDSKGLWSTHIEQTVKEAHQRLGAINRVKQYLKDDGVCIAYKAFVRSKLEYGNLIYWGAAETHLAKLDCVQQQAQRLFEGVHGCSIIRTEKRSCSSRTNMPAYVRKYETTTQTSHSYHEESK